MLGLASGRRWFDSCNDHFRSPNFNCLNGPSSLNIDAGMAEDDQEMTPVIRARKFASVAALAALTLLGLHGGPGRALAQVNPYTSIGLEWTAGGDDGDVGRASSYEMRYGTSAPAPGDTTTWWNNPSLSVPWGNLPSPKTSGLTDSTRVTGLTPGTAYYFVLRSRDDGGNASAFSNVASATTITCDPPSASPDPFSATADTGLVDLAWSANDPTADVRIYRGTGSNTPTLLTTRSPGTTSYQDTAVQPGTTYGYRVAFATTCNEPPSYSVTVIGPYSATRTVTLPGQPPAPPSETGSASIHGYPNPSSGSVQFVFRLEGTVARDAHVRLFDMSGHWIATIVDQRLNPGEQTITWPRTDRNGRRVSPGYYEAVGTIGNTRVRERIVLTP